MIDQLGHGQCILFGHDWGAPIVYTTALLYPEKVTAIAGLSVPYHPRSEVRILELWERLFPDRFFYQTYFQAEGVAEAELEADVPASLRKVYYSISGDLDSPLFLQKKPKDAGLLDGLIDPDPYPAW
ncbi:unnamed protein product, partial [marine sediment metagenome]